VEPLIFKINDPEIFNQNETAGIGLLLSEFGR